MDGGCGGLEQRQVEAGAGLNPSVRRGHRVQVAITPFHAYPGPRDAGRDDLWILSRTPELDREVLDGIYARLAAAGFNVEKLTPTLQQGCD